LSEFHQKLGQLGKKNNFMYYRDYSLNKYAKGGEIAKALPKYEILVGNKVYDYSNKQYEYPVIKKSTRHRKFPDEVLSYHKTKNQAQAEVKRLNEKYKMADGGIMATGGNIAEITEKDFANNRVIKRGNIEIELSKDFPTHYYAHFIDISKDGGELVSVYANKNWNKVVKEIETFKYEMGGEMASRGMVTKVEIKNNEELKIIEKELSDRGYKVSKTDKVWVMGSGDKYFKAKKQKAESIKNDLNYLGYDAKIQLDSDGYYDIYVVGKLDKKDSSQINLFAKGGMMAKGGLTSNIYYEIRDENDRLVESYLSSDELIKWAKEYSKELNENVKIENVKQAIKYIEKYQQNPKYKYFEIYTFDNSGMMAKGGKMTNSGIMADIGRMYKGDRKKIKFIYVIHKRDEYGDIIPKPVKKMSVIRVNQTTAKEVVYKKYPSKDYFVELENAFYVN
jgi:rRNA maturation endonuclease Nob1